jgi:hypothetical protein
MFNFIITIIVALGLALLFLNVYFRVKVFKVYKLLIKNRVEFNSSHIFSARKMEEEITPKYPESAEDIRLFARHIKFSLSVAVLLVLLITFFGSVLMYFR